MANDGDKRAKEVLELAENYDNLLSTILVGNNIVNIAMTSLATVLFITLYPKYGATIATAVTTIVVLIFGEISPKSLAKENPEKFAMFSAPVIRFFMLILAPINWIFAQWKKVLAKVFNADGVRPITEEELLTMVEEAQTEGGIDEEQSELIQNAIEFNDLDAWDVLTPRVDIMAIEIDETEEEVEEVSEEDAETVEDEAVTIVQIWQCPKCETVCDEEICSACGEQCELIEIEATAGEITEGPRKNIGAIIGGAVAAVVVLVAALWYFGVINPYEKGYIDRVLTTNLTYQTPELLEKPYYVNCDMSKYISLLIDTLNHDASISELLNPLARIHKLVDEYKANGGHIN